MNVIQNSLQVSEILRDLSETLDVPPSKYEEAKVHYQAVGDWLGEKDSELAAFNPQIYPQGSFALGTAVRPLGKDEYDVDAVCLLDLTSDQVTQKQLKDMVGRRLKHPSSRYSNKIEPPDGKCRCWTIQYADESQFHLDVLPCVQDDIRWLISMGIPHAIAEHAIRLTDKNTPEYSTGWPLNGHGPTHSNPKGYGTWFRDRMKVRLTEAKAALAMEKRASVEEIKDYQVRTPLQRAVQILKRHRDVRYNGDCDKPISIIITTLAAKAYDNEADLYEALMNIVPGMRNHIEQRNGVWWVANPVNPLENFADKWQATPRKAELFFDWLNLLEAEYQRMATDAGLQKIGTYLAESYGERDAKATMTKYASRHVGRTGLVSGAPVILMPKSSNLNDPSYTNIKVTQPSKPWGA
jgi:hypothetical protein